MLTDLVLTLLEYVIDGAFGLVDFIFPDSWLPAVDQALQVFGQLLSFTPAATLVGLMALAIAIDLGFNAYTFVITTYKLVPFKAS